MRNFVRNVRMIFNIRRIAPLLALDRRSILLSLLILSLSMPLNCGCFPDKSPEIEEQTKKDADIAPLEAEVQQKAQAFKEALVALKKKYPKLEKSAFKKAELKNLFEQKYIPYLEVSEKLSKHNATNHPNAVNRKQYERKAKDERLLINNISTWIANDDRDKLHEHIVKYIQIWQVS